MSCRVGLGFGLAGVCQHCLRTFRSVNHPSIPLVTLSPLFPPTYPSSYSLNGSDIFRPTPRHISPFPSSFLSHETKAGRTPIILPRQPALSQHFPWWNTYMLDTILPRSTKTRFRFVRASASRSLPEMTFIAMAGGRCVRSLLRLAHPRLPAPLQYPFSNPAPSSWRSRGRRNGHTRILCLLSSYAVSHDLLSHAIVMGHALMELLSL